MDVLDLNQIAKKWQKKWEEKKIFQTKEDSKKPKYYVLEMFPYPSASFLHMGHVRNYTIGDAIARFKRMMGFNVLYPMGYDSFGLPAENAAKKEGIHPRIYTDKAIKKIMEFQKGLGNSYDWTRVIATHEPEYYKWNQYFFLKFLEKGLVYRKKAPVNWCPQCSSTLANEEVVNGHCWRHEDTVVEQKELEQWFLKITEYADELLKDIDKLDWSDRIKTLQRNWIGKSEGAKIKFNLIVPGQDNKHSVEVFTTRPDTLFGVTFMVVSPELANSWLNVGWKASNEVKAYIKKTLSERAKDLENKEKTGVFTQVYAINPVNNEKIPVWVSDYVLADYGTGAIMAVPAHDERDFEFAKKFDLPIKQVISHNSNKITNEAYVGDGVLINSGEFNGLSKTEAIDKISKFLEKNKLGKKTTQFKIRDWLISRQRYWGTPIPIVYCNKCGTVPLKDKDLPLELPEKVDFHTTGNPILQAKSWIEVKCPKCKGNARRETDTMGGFVDSSWYFLRYCSPHSDKAPFDAKAAKYWMPVDQYVGGIEHAVGHLIYSRFWTKCLRDLGMVSIDEPFTRLFNQGVVYKDGHKMSKSFGNVVYQTEISEKQGIDTARLFLMFVANPESDMEWSDNGIEGSYRFLQKVARTSESKFAKENDIDSHKRNLAIKVYTDLIERFKFNLAIVELMQYSDYVADHPTKEGYSDLLKMLSPFAPHLAEEMWSRMGNKSFISLEEWPKSDKKKISSEIEFVDNLLNSTASDIRDILKMVKIENPKKITLIISEPWKYELYSKVKELLLKTRNTGDVMKAVMATSLKQHGQDIQRILPKLVQTGVSEVLNTEKEFKALKDNSSYFKKEFGASIEIVKAQDSKLPKAKNASPGKPAIVVE